MQKLSFRHFNFIPKLTVRIRQFSQNKNHQPKYPHQLWFISELELSHKYHIARVQKFCQGGGVQLGQQENSLDNFFIPQLISIFFQGFKGVQTFSGEEGCGSKCLFL